MSRPRIELTSAELHLVEDAVAGVNTSELFNLKAFSSSVQIQNKFFWCLIVSIRKEINLQFWANRILSHVGGMSFLSGAGGGAP